MSFYTSLTGLNGAQADIATISNNVANVGTTGFKRARAEFGDIFATSPLQNAGSAIGSGTILKSVKQQFTQGNIQASLNALDLAITGQGFFAMKPSLTSSQTVYTRNGSFSVNNDRYVVDSKGQYMQVFPVNDDGSVIATGIDSARNLQLPVNSGLPEATTKIELGLNLPADAEIIPKNAKYTATNPYSFNKDDAATFNRSTSITIYDSLGNPTIATIYYVKTSNATETSPTNKWQTYVYVGDKQLDPALIAAKDEQGSTLYINKFGQVTSDPQSIDSAFQTGAAHPLYKLDQQDTKEPSSPSAVVGSMMKNIGFDFGDTDSNKVEIITDSARWAETKEGQLAAGETPDSNPPFWGNDMFTIAVDGSEPVTISIKAGKYTGTELAAEMTRAVNEAFGDDKYVKITDTYVRGTGATATVVPGNDIVRLDLFKLDEDGNPQGLDEPIEIDLLGSAGAVGTAVDGSGAVAPNRDLQLTRSELIKLVQTKLNEQMNLRYADLGKAGDTWVDNDDPTTWPITVGYDVANRALTFSANRNQIGPSANELPARFNSFQVFVPNEPVTGSSIGVPLKAVSTDTLIRAGTQWVGNDLVPDGEYILDPLDHRFGISVAYNKDSRQFSFVSGKTGEDSKIRVGRAQLTDEPVAQVDSFDLTSVSLAANKTLTVEIRGKSFTYTNSGTTALAGAALATAVAAAFSSDGGEIEDLAEGTEAFALTASSGRLLLKGFADGSRFTSTFRVDGTILSSEAVTGDSKTGSVAGLELGTAVLGTDDDAPFLGGTNYLLGIGSGLVVNTVSGKGLASTSAMAVGNRAIVPLNQTFVLNETLGENIMTFTVDGIVGTIALPVRAYTGETFAAAIQERVNQIEDPATGRTVSGVTVKFDPDNNRLVFTSGTTGSSSQINVVGHPNFGLRDVVQTRGQVPIITNLEQATDAEGNLLYIDENGEIVTQKPTKQQNWFPLYLDQGELTFDTFGKLISPKEGVIYSPFDPSNGSDLIRLTIDYGKFSTQYSQPFSVLSLEQDGYPSGRLDGLDIDASGTVRANYTNGRTQALGKIILSNFANPNGLKQVGNANYVATSVSGDPLLGEPGSDGFGTIQSGSLERSNVDITEELVNLITAQRNFQANAKAIETTTTLTNTIIQIRG